MTLKSKIGFLLLTTAIILGISNFCIQQFTIRPTNLNLEKSFVEKDMERCVEALNRQLQHLDNTVDDWASWDDSYTFVQDIDLEYIKSNLLQNTFLSNKINLIYFIDNDGWVIWGKAYETNFTQELQLIDFPRRFPKFHPLFQHGKDQPSIKGAFITEKGPMLIAARPITTSDRTGRPMGTLIMGQFLSKSLVDKLIEQTRVILSITTFTQKDINLQPILKQFAAGTTYPTSIINDNSLYAYATFPGISNKPILLLRGELTRDLFLKNRIALYKYSILMGILCITLFLILLFILERTTLIPLQNLVLHTKEIREQKDLLSRLPAQNRTDEISTLTNEMNHLLDFQSKSHETLEHQVENRTTELLTSNNLLKAEIELHQKTQQEFTRINDELEAIFTTSRVGIMLLRGGRVLNKCNQRLAEIYGYASPEEMKLMSMKELHLNEERFLEFGEKHYKTLKLGAQIQVEYEFRRKDGSKIWCSLSGMAMDSTTPPDLDKGVTWVVDDISNRKEEEQKLAELARMQGMFATIGGVCHELGQPVQIISAHTQLLKKQTDLSNQQVNRVRSIYEQTERMGNILKNLQTITHFETTDYVAGLKILDINKSSSPKRKRH